MGSAEDAVRRRISSEQGEHARQEAAIQHQRDILTSQIYAEARSALHRLEALGFPGAKLEQARYYTRFWSRRIVRAYWDIVCHTSTHVEHGTSHVYAQLFSDGTFVTYRNGGPSSTLPRDLADLQTLHNNVKNLGR